MNTLKWEVGIKHSWDSILPVSPASDSLPVANYHHATLSVSVPQLCTDSLAYITEKRSLQLELSL